MINGFQIVLSVVIVALTSVLTLVGIQVYLILREVQKTFQKLNSTLDEVRNLVSGASQSLEGTVGFLGGLKTILRILSLFKKRSEGNE